MGLLSEYFSEPKYLNLADVTKNKNVSRPKSVDSNSSTLKDVKTSIRDLKENDWFTFATVNLCTTMFSKAKFHIISEDKEIWVQFFERMRTYGNNTSLRRLRSDLKGDMTAYGSCYIEFVEDVKGTEILDLKRMDASRTNNAKDRKGQLIYDEKGDSIGYVLSLGPNADLRSKGDKVPEPYAGSVNLQQGDIFLLPERVAEIAMYKRANGVESIGIVEPSILQTKRRRDLETAQVNAIWIRGTSPLFAEVGDNEHEPTPQMLNDALDSLTDMVHSKASAFPHYVKPKTIDAKIDDIATTITNGLLSSEASTAGLPLPFVTGQGEATNRATLKTQREMFEDNIQDKIRNFDEDWNLLVMEKIAKKNKYEKGVIKSGNIRLEAKDEFAKRLQMYYGMRALSPKEIRMNIQTVEDLELDEKDYKEFIETPEPTNVTQSYSVKGNSGKKVIAPIAPTKNIPTEIKPQSMS